MLGENEVLDQYVRSLKKHVRGRGMKPLAKLLNLKRTYPEDAFGKALEQALQYNLYDLHRLEGLILKFIAGNYFNLNYEEASW